MGKYIDVKERLMRRVVVMKDGCWNFTGTLNHKGYGNLWNSGMNRKAHRVAYEIFVGRIPAGMQIDHVCGNRACVNPEHLEAVTPAENNRRSPTASTINALKTHCKNGHEFSPENTYRCTKKGKNSRMCRTCSMNKRHTMKKEKKMRVLNTFPPNWNKIKAAFPNAEAEQAVFCYGDVVHNPFNAVVSRDLEIHEAVHREQQGKNPEEWWDRYISDPEFRLEQEIQAYGLQLHYLKTTKVTKLDDYGKEVEIHLPNRVIEWYLDQIAKTLSGPLYGNVIEYHKAHSRIRHFIKNV